MVALIKRVKISHLLKSNENSIFDDWKEINISELQLIDITMNNFDGDEGLRGGKFFTITYSFLGSVCYNKS